jgi:hypothetical protein
VAAVAAAAAASWAATAGIATAAAGCGELLVLPFFSFEPTRSSIRFRHRFLLFRRTPEGAKGLLLRKLLAAAMLLLAKCEFEK